MCYAQAYARTNMSQKELMEFVKNARVENERRRVEASEKSGNKPFLALDVGETKVTLLPEIPAVRQSSYGKEQYCFVVEHEGVQKTWTVTINSPLAIKVINKLLKAPTPVVIVRSGEGKSTRLDLKEKKE